MTIKKTKNIQYYQHQYDLYKADGSFQGSWVFDICQEAMPGNKEHPDAVKFLGKFYVRDADGDYVEGDRPV